MTRFCHKLLEARREEEEARNHSTGDYVSWLVRLSVARARISWVISTAVMGDTVLCPVCKNQPIPDGITQHGAVKATCGMCQGYGYALAECVEQGVA